MTEQNILKFMVFISTKIIYLNIPYKSILTYRYTIAQKMLVLFNAALSPFNVHYSLMAQAP